MNDDSKIAFIQRQFLVERLENNVCYNIFVNFGFLDNSHPIFD
jgi:hypothetical protein